MALLSCYSSLARLNLLLDQNVSYWSINASRRPSKESVYGKSSLSYGILKPECSKSPIIVWIIFFLDFNPSLFLSL